MTIANLQPVPLTISSMTAPTSFTVTQNCVKTIPAYGSCSFVMTFVPTVVGYVQGNVVITSDARAGSPSTILLKGTGVAP